MPAALPKASFFWGAAPWGLQMVALKALERKNLRLKKIVAC